MTQFPNPRKAAGQLRIPRHTKNDPRQQPFWKARRLPPSPDVRTERRTGRRAPCPSGRRRRGPCRHRRTQAGPLPWPFPHSPPHGRPCPSCGQAGPAGQPRGPWGAAAVTGVHSRGSMTLDRQSRGAPPDRAGLPRPGRCGRSASTRGDGCCDAPGFRLPRAWLTSRRGGTKLKAHQGSPDKGLRVCWAARQRSDPSNLIQFMLA